MAYYFNPKYGASTNSGKGYSKVVITSGGTYTIAVGDTITGATSGVTAKVLALTNTSGSFGAGTWAGSLHTTEPRLTGAYTAFTATETLNVGANIDVGTVSSTARYDSYQKIGDLAGVSMTGSDDLRISESPAPTLIGSCIWTKKDYVLYSQKTISSATNATPIVCTSNAHGFAVGDYVIISGATANTALNGIHRISVKDTNTFTLQGTVGNGTTAGTVICTKITPMTVELPADTVRVLCTPTGTSTIWTIANSGTTGNSATGAYVDAPFIKTGYTTSKASNSYNRQYIAQQATAVANTLYGYIQIGNGTNVNLSAYQKISILIYISAPTSSVQTGVIKLCSDTAGATPVNTFTLPAIPTSSTWHCIEIDNGSALGSNIQSIAYYSGATAVNSLQVSFAQIVVSKAETSADSVSLCDIISKNSTQRGSEGWYSISQFIDYGTGSNQCAILGLPLGTTTRYTFYRSVGYSGASAAVNTYVIHPFFYGLVANSSFSHTFQKAGVLTDLRQKLTGGYNVATDELSSESFLSGGGSSYAFGNTMSSVDISRVSCLMFSGLFYNSSIGSGLHQNYDAHTVGAIASIFNSRLSDGKFSVNNVTFINGVNFSYGAGDFETDLYSTIESNNNYNLVKWINKSGTRGVVAGGVGSVYFPDGSRVYNQVFENNAGAFIGMISASNSPIYFRNCVFNGAEFAMGTNSIESYVVSELHDGTADTLIYSTYIQGWIKDLGFGTGVGLELGILHTAVRLHYPFNYKIATFAVASSGLVTITCKIRKTHATRIAGLIGVKSGRAGLTSNTFVETTDNADTFNVTTLTFTPTSADTVDIYARVYLKNDSVTLTDKVFFDDFTFSQA